jgi:hypothetical protein
MNSCSIAKYERLSFGVIRPSSTSLRRYPREYSDTNIPTIAVSMTNNADKPSTYHNEYSVVVPRSASMHIGIATSPINNEPIVETDDAHRPFGIKKHINAVIAGMANNNSTEPINPSASS